MDNPGPQPLARPGGGACRVRRRAWWSAWASPPIWAAKFIAGLVILAVLSFVLSLLQRVAANTRKRVTAGEASYRAFFDHAVEGIFRTTPEGHYLAVNQALADIYGYATPEALIAGLTDIGAQLYVDPAPPRRIPRPDAGQ